MAELIKTDRAVMTGPVLAELLQGMKNKKQAKMLDDLLNILPFKETSRADWKKGDRSCERFAKKASQYP